MFRKIVTLSPISLAILALVSMALAKGGAPAGGTPPAATADADFDGKVVCVTMKDGDNRIIEKARLKRLGERAFIVGNAVKFIADAPEMAYWIPVDDVRALTIFHNVDDFKKHATLQEKNSEGR